MNKVLKLQHQQKKVMSKYEAVLRDYGGYITVAYKGSYN